MSDDKRSSQSHKDISEMGAQFLNVAIGEKLAVLKELPDGTMVVRREGGDVHVYV